MTLDSRDETERWGLLTTLFLLSLEIPDMMSNHSVVEMGRDQVTAESLQVLISRTNPENATACRRLHPRLGSRLSPVVRDCFECPDPGYPFQRPYTAVLNYLAIPSVFRALGTVVTRRNRCSFCPPLVTQVHKFESDRKAKRIPPHLANQ